MTGSDVLPYMVPAEYSVGAPSVPMAETEPVRTIVTSPPYCGVAGAVDEGTGAEEVGATVVVLPVVGAGVEVDVAQPDRIRIEIMTSRTGIDHFFITVPPSRIIF